MKKRTCRWLFTTLIGVLSAAASAASTEPGKRVHGPVATNENQTLTFYEKDKNVTAWFTGPEETEDRTFSDYELIEDTHYAMGNVSIVAVFYQDLDLGGQDEVIVMYRDANGKQHLKAWGADGVKFLPLPRFTPQLEKVAASLDKFTVASARKAISHLLPQQYLITAVPQDLPDPLFTEVLNAPDKYRYELLRYFDEYDKDAENLKSGTGYSLIFPDKFIERTNEKGENIRYTLTMDIQRQGLCGNDDAGFAIAGLYYQHVAAANDYRREGPFIYLSQQGCQLNPLMIGHYRNNKFNGEWSYFNADEGRLQVKGAYRDGLREGPWVKYNADGQRQEGIYHLDEIEGVWQTFSDSGEVIETQTWKNNKLSGLWQRKVQQAGNESAWVIEEEGQYLNGLKEGPWKEEMSTRPRYAQYRNGLLDGELRVTTLEGQNVISKRYQQGLVNGEVSEWLDNGKLKRHAVYQNGQLQKEEVYDKNSGQLYQAGNWKIVYPAASDLCKNLPSQEACNSRAARLAASLKDGEWRTWHEDGVLATLSHWQEGEKIGAEYKFNHTGKLYSYERWDGKYYPAEGTSYDYSSGDDYAHKPVQMRLSSDSHVLKPDLEEQTLFHDGTANISSHNLILTSPLNVYEVNGRVYSWRNSGFLSSIVQKEHGRETGRTSWDDQGVIIGQLVKTNDDRFSDRSYSDGALFSLSYSLANIYYHHNDKVIAPDPSSRSVTHYYDPQGKEIPLEELRKRPKPKNFRFISE